MMNRTDELVIRVTPDRGELTVEQETGGVISRKTLTTETFAKCILESRINNEAHFSGLLPEGCIAVTMMNGKTCYVVRYPELRADISYFGTEYADFPLPRLVFSFTYEHESRKTSNVRMCVVKDEHLTAKTPTYLYPFSNVYGNNHICLGRNELPHYKDPSRLTALAAHILHMPNNNDMYSASNNRLKLDYRELLEHLKDKTPEYYYTHILVPDGRTLGNFMGGCA